MAGYKYTDTHRNIRIDIEGFNLIYRFNLGLLRLKNLTPVPLPEAVFHEFFSLSQWGV